jgi:hypothetical protein
MTVGQEGQFLMGANVGTDETKKRCGHIRGRIPTR